MVILPQEIKDLIFLELDYKNILNTRDLQSAHVKNITYHNTLTDAILKGNLGNVKWLHSNRYKSLEFYTSFDNAYELAAFYGHLEILKFLTQIRYPAKLNDYVFSAAAEKGHLHIMRWLKDNDFPWSEKTFALASENGNLDNMKWLKENGCPLDTTAIIAALKNENLQNLRWLKQNGCPIDETEFKRKAFAYPDLLYEMIMKLI